MTSLGLEGGQEALGQQLPKPVLEATSIMKQMSTDHLGNSRLNRVKLSLFLLLLIGWLIGFFVPYFLSTGLLQAYFNLDQRG